MLTNNTSYRFKNINILLHVGPWLYSLFVSSIYMGKLDHPLNLDHFSTTITSAHTQNHQCWYNHPCSQSIFQGVNPHCPHNDQSSYYHRQKSRILPKIFESPVFTTNFPRGQWPFKKFPVSMWQSRDHFKVIWRSFQKVPFSKTMTVFVHKKLCRLWYQGYPRSWSATWINLATPHFGRLREGCILRKLCWLCVVTSLKPMRRLCSDI